MAVQTREERLEELEGLYVLNSYRANLNENAYFEVEVDSGSVDKRGSVKISLEGIKLVFKRNKIEVENGQEKVTPISIEFNTLRREHYIGRKRPAMLPSYTELQYEEVKLYSFSKENDEIINLIHLVMENFLVNIDRLFTEEEIEEKMQLFRKYNMEKDLDGFLFEIANCYNAFINEDNYDLDRDDRAEEIRLNEDFIEQIGLICKKFWIGLDFKLIDSKTGDLPGFDKLRKKYEEVLDKIDGYIKARETYGEVSLKRGKRRNYKKNKERLEVIKEEFEALKKEYKKILECKEKALKGTANKKDLEVLLEDFEKKVERCLIRLENVSTSYSFDEYVCLMDAQSTDASRKGIRDEDYKNSVDSLRIYSGMGESIGYYIDEFDEFRRSHKGISSALSKDAIRRQKEALAPYMENLRERGLIYKKFLSAKTRKIVRNVNDKKSMRISDIMALKQFLEDEIRTLELYNRLEWTLYTRDGQFVWGGVGEEKCYKELLVHIEALVKFKSEIQKELEKSEETKIQALLSCADQSVKASLYDRFMAEEYKDKTGTLSTDADKANIFNKALKKKVSGSGFLQDLMNPIDAFDDIENLYKGYLEYTLMKGMLEKILSVLKDASTAMGDISVAEEITGNNFNKNTEESANSRFNAMNSR